MALGLLAPVPERHLESAFKTPGPQGEVAFGSCAFETFKRLDDLLSGQTCDCLIYASHSVKPLSSPTVTWMATYVRFVEARNNGTHPNPEFRPLTTESDSQWYVFWHVGGLKQLSREERIKISTLHGYEKPKRYLTNFIPEGPVIIDW